MGKIKTGGDLEEDYSKLGGHEVVNSKYVYTLKDKTINIGVYYPSEKVRLSFYRG